MNYKLEVADSFLGDDAEVEKYRNIWSEYLARNPDATKQYLFYPLSCRYDKVLAVFDPEKSEIIDYLPVDTARPSSNIALGFTREELEEYRKLIEDH